MAKLIIWVLITIIFADTMRILFLSAYVQPYLAAGVRALLQLGEYDILLYCNGSDSYAYLELPEDNNKFQVVTFNHAPDAASWEMLQAFKPDIVVCAGWMYKRYLLWCARFKRLGVKTVCAMDTQWRGDLRQRLFCIAAKMFIGQVFSHAWVPGPRQQTYAQNMGFTTTQILQHLYAPDTKLFGTAFKDGVSKPFFRRFVYVGRLEAHKVLPLIQAYSMIKESSAWSLDIVGAGSLKPRLVEKYSDINFHNQMSQVALVDFVSKGGVFCLCSTDEPWGTVVQEFAAAGMPLLLSKQVGASDVFLKGNGYICDGERIEDIAEQLKRFQEMTDDALNEMALKSHRLGMATSTLDWVAQILSIHK